MNWLPRIERLHPQPATAPEDSTRGRVERVSPGIAALLEGVTEDRSHAVLDLGPAADSSLSVYGRFARWIRFADLSSLAGGQEDTAALKALPPHPKRPYDLVFAWNILDQLAPEERPLLVQRLVEITAPNARLYVIVEGSGDSPHQALRFALTDVDRMRYEPTGSPLMPWAHLLPAELEKLLLPFQVVKAFTSKIGLREYVAVRRH